MSRIAHISSAGSGGGGGGPVTVVGTYTPIDTQVNPTDLVGVENFAMVWSPAASLANPNAWSRWGHYGVDDDITPGRVPGIAIFGRPEISLGETPQSVGVLNNLLDGAEVSHSLAVASFARFRDGTSPVLSRQSDGNADDNPNSTVGATGNMVYDAVGDNWDRQREATADNMPSTGMPASGTMVFDGANWDRWTGAVSVSNTVTVTGTVELGAATLAALETITVVGTARDDTDNQAPVATGGVLTVDRLYGYDVVGGNWDRLLAVAGRLQVDAAFSGIATVVGNQTPGDGITTPTDALDTRTFLELYNPLTGKSDLARKNPYDGLSVDLGPATILLEQLVKEQRRTNRLLEILIGETPKFTELDLESDG